MRRPLFAAALFLVVIAAVRLKVGWADDVQPGFVSTEWLSASDTLLVTGQVYQKDDTSFYLRSVVIRESNAFGLSYAESGREIHCQENLMIETETARTVPLGSIVAVRGVFYPCSPATNPGEFDAFVYYRSQRIGGRLRKAEILALGEDYWRVREGLAVLKQYLKEKLYAVFPEKDAAVMSALLLGDKKDLDGELKDLYRRNGILHILSISSLHITILGMSVYRLLRKMGMPIPPAAAAGSILLLLYGCMTGFSVSACRAIGMYLIRMLAEVTGRTYDMLTALGILAAGMVIVNPYHLQNSGFLLSFSSVLGIGVVYPLLAPEKKSRRSKIPETKPLSAIKEVPIKLAEDLKQSFFASLCITLTTLPVQLWFYYEIPVYSVFLNLFVIPLVKPMMITGLLVLAVPGAGILSIVDRMILGTYELLCGCFDRLPFHTWNPGCPRIWQIGVYYLLLAGAVLFRQFMKKREAEEREKGCSGEMHGEKQREGETGKKRIRESGKSGKGNRIVCIGTVIMAVMLFAIRPLPENSVIFLDVGQGDCILVRTASGENYLFDCGSSSRSSVGKYVLLPYLKYNGIHYIDAMFLSHPDTDHVNGALELLEMGEGSNVQVGQLLLPSIEEGMREEQLGELLHAASVAEQEGGIPVGYLAAGDSWSCESADFICLHPARGFEAQDVNACSECVYVEFKNASSADHWSLLLTGDVQEKGEEAFLEELRKRNIRNISVLKAAHHGSRNSTPKEELDQLKPLVTVISCGRNNRYGHPHAELLERLEAVGTYVLQTAESGAVRIVCKDGNVRAEPFVWSD